MTIAEANKIYESDQELYIVDKNREFLTWFYDKLKKGYKPYLSIEGINDLINKIKLWYEFKYPNRELEYNNGIISTNFEGIENISDNMDFDQLRYRLAHPELKTFDCEYRSYCGHCQPDWGGYDESITDGHGWVDFIGFKVYANCPDEMKIVRLMTATAIGGIITPFEMTRLEEFIGRTPTQNITLKELIEIIRNNSNMSSPDLENIEFTYETDLELRKRIIEMINLALIYSKETTPEYGKERAVKFSEDVSKKYNIDITSPELPDLANERPEKPNRVEALKLSNLKRKVKKLENPKK